MEKTTFCMRCGARFDGPVGEDPMARHDCPGEMPPDPFGVVLGEAIEHSIEDPFTGEITVRFRLF